MRDGVAAVQSCWAPPRTCACLQVRHVDLVDPDRPQGAWKALPKQPRDAGQPWGRVWRGPQHVLYGHHATRRLQVRLRRGAPCTRARAGAGTD